MNVALIALFVGFAFGFLLGVAISIVVLRK